MINFKSVVWRCTFIHKCNKTITNEPAALYVVNHKFVLCKKSTHIIIRECQVFTSINKMMIIGVFIRTIACRSTIWLRMPGGCCQILNWQDKVWRRCHSERMSGNYGNRRSIGDPRSRDYNSRSGYHIQLKLCAQNFNAPLFSLINKLNLQKKKIQIILTSK